MPSGATFSYVPTILRPQAAKDNPFLYPTKPQEAESHNSVISAKACPVPRYGAGIQNDDASEIVHPDFERPWEPTPDCSDSVRSQGESRGVLPSGSLSAACLLQAGQAGGSGGAAPSFQRAGGWEPRTFSPPAGLPAEGRGSGGCAPSFQRAGGRESRTSAPLGPCQWTRPHQLRTVTPHSTPLAPS